MATTFERSILRLNKSPRITPFPLAISNLMQVGHAPGVVLHSYDIASAYPHGGVQLPSMAGGEWLKFIENKFNSLAQLKASIEAASPISMFYLDYEFPLYEHFEGDDWKKIYVPWYPLFYPFE